MATPSFSSEEPSALGVLGFSAQQEELYRVVLRNSGSTLDHLGALTGLPPDELHDHVSRFAGAGVVDVREGVVRARPPAEAIARLVTEEAQRVQRRAEQLEAVRELMPALNAEHLTATAPRGRPVAIEQVEGGDVAQLVRSLAATSTGDLLWLRPDPWRATAGRLLDGWVREMVRSGRRSRAIYPARALEEAPDVIRDRAEAGEHVRILAEVPSRLLVLGATAALVPEEFGQPGDRRLVIRQSGLVGSLTLLFECLWESAMAVPGLGGGRPDGDTSSEQKLLLGQLAAGAKDEQIARVLGLSLRTVRRRVAEVMSDLGADSRFQAGVEAVRRGWI